MIKIRKEIAEMKRKSDEIERILNSNEKIIGLEK